MNFGENFGSYKKQYNDQDFCFDINAKRCTWKENEHGMQECSSKSFATLSVCPDFSVKQQMKIRATFPQKDIQFLPKQELETFLKRGVKELKKEYHFQSVDAEPFIPYPILSCTRIYEIYDDTYAQSKATMETKTIGTLCPETFSEKKKQKIISTNENVKFVPKADYQAVRSQFGSYVGNGRFLTFEEFYPFKKEDKA